MLKRFMALGLMAAAVGLLRPNPGFGKDLAARSVWAAGPIRIDGLAEDWDADPRSVHEKTKVEFAFHNDSDYLYLLLVFKDPHFQSTLEKSGVAVYFNSRGEDKKDRGIRFTKAVLTADQFIARRQSQGRPLNDQQIAEVRAKRFCPLFMYGLINKKDLEQMAKAKPSLSPDFNAGFAGGVWTYEFKIPLAKTEDQPFGIGAEPGGKVQIGIEWGGRTERPTQQEADFTRRISDMDAPGQESQVRLGTPKYDFWVAVELASEL
jgi:hypothetical protein